MVDFRRFDKLWKKRHDRSDIEWRVKYLKESSFALSNICRLHFDHKSNNADPESVLKAMRDVFVSFTRSRNKRVSSTYDTILTNDCKTPILLESIISTVCDSCNDVEIYQQSNLEFLTSIANKSKSIGSDIRSRLQSARQKYDEATERHKRAQHALYKARQCVEASSSGCSPELLARLNSASDREYQTSRDCDVQADHLHAHVLQSASMEVQVAQLFLQFIEAEATALEESAKILRDYVPTMKMQIQDYVFQPIFGLDLEIHLQLCNRSIAFVLDTCVSLLSNSDAIKSEGLFRVTPNSVKLKKMVSELNHCSVNKLTEVYDDHVVAAALKQYLRDLPKSLMIESTPSKRWQDAARMSQLSEKLVAIRNILCTLSTSYYENLRFIFTFLKKVVAFQHVNKMNSNNIAICMACNLCFSERDRRTISCAPLLVALFIDHFNDIFGDEGVEVVKVESKELKSSDSHGSSLSNDHCIPVNNINFTQNSKYSSKGRAPPPPSHQPPKPKLSGYHHSTIPNEKRPTSIFSTTDKVYTKKDSKTLSKALRDILPFTDKK